MGEPIEQRRRHLGVAEDGRPFAEAEVGGDDDAGALVEPSQPTVREPANPLQKSTVSPSSTRRAG